MNIADSTNTDNVELHLPSILGYEKIARQAAEAVAEQMDFTPERIEDLKTAVAEACMNAIEHGNNLERGIHVTVQMLIMPDKLEVRVADVGVQPIPEILPPAGSGDMRGWGMFFIQNLVDKMEITRLPDGGNEVRMILYLAPSEMTPEPGDAEKPAETQPATTGGTGAETTPSPAGAVTVPGAIQTVEPKLVAIQPAEPKPAAIQLAEVKPVAVEPVEPKPVAIQPAEAKPSAILPAESKPSAILPAPDNAAATFTDSSTPLPES